MKILRSISVVVLMLILFTTAQYALDKTSITNKVNEQATIKSLLIGLNSDNFGLKTSSAQMLGELRVNAAVIPLMNMLHSEKNEEARIVAALALYKIGDSKGLYAVKQAIKFDESLRVRKLCSNFYTVFVANNISEPVNLAIK